MINITSPSKKRIRPKLIKRERQIIETAPNFILS